MAQSKLDKMIAVYRRDLIDHFGIEVDHTMLKAIASWQGVNNFRQDARLVSSSDPSERQRLVESIVRKFELDDDLHEELETTVDEILAQYGQNAPQKFRVPIIHMVARRMNRRDVFVDPLIPEDFSDPNDGSDPNFSGQGGGDIHEGDNEMPIVFIDAKQEEARNTARLRKIWRDLQQREEKNANLSKDERKRLEFLTSLLEDPPEFSLDNTYVTLRQEMAKIHVHNNFPKLKDGEFDDGVNAGDISDEAILVAAVWAAVEFEGVVTPQVEDGSVAEMQNGVVTSIKVPNLRHVSQMQ